jgi:hypothetical protein
VTTGFEFLAALSEPGLLVDVEADAVAGAVDVARLRRRVGPERRVAGVLVDVAGRGVDRLAGRPGFERVEGRVQRLLGEVVELPGRRRGLALHEGPGHVGVVLRGLVAREDVDHDGLVGLERARAAIVRVGSV